MLSWGLNIWQGMFADMFVHLRTAPSEFGGGAVWDVITNINEGLKGIGYGLLILFFLMSLFKTTTNFKEISLQNVIGWIVRFLLVKIFIDYSMMILEFFISISMGVNNVIFTMGSTALVNVEMPQGLVEAAQEFSQGNPLEVILMALETVPLFLLSFISIIVVFVAGIVLIVTVYLRFFKVFIFTALAPVPLSTFGSTETSSIGKHFLKSYAAICLEICIITIACVIFNALMSSNVMIFDSWKYVGDTEWAGKQFWDQAVNFIFTLALQSVILTTAVIGVNKMARDLIGV